MRAWLSVAVALATKDAGYPSTVKGKEPAEAKDPGGRQ